jgi:hypothetical protein
LNLHLELHKTLFFPSSLVHIVDVLAHYSLIPTFIGY